MFVLAGAMPACRSAQKADLHDILVPPEREEALGSKLDQNISACPKIGNCPAIGSSKKAKYILETSAGSVQKTGIKIGDQAVIKLGETHAD